jgi:large conductance mechanosensitive channel
MLSREEDTMSLATEFKEFALRGNVVDLAVGVIIGAAFGRIITSLVDDVLMPLLGAIGGERDFSDYFITLSGGEFETLAAAKEAGAATLNYGMFINAVLQFLIVALAIFLAIRQLNRMSRKPAQDVTPTMRDCPECLGPVPREAHRCRFCAQPLPASA